MARVAFCGLGVMGAPMAGHLAAAGHAVTVYNRTAARALDWVARHGHRATPTPAEAAQGAEVVLLCVGNDDDVRQVVLGPHGVLDAMAAGSILVDHTTASATLARELAAACAARGVGFVDAPVSGGQAGAERGQLTVMCGADDEAAFAAARDVIAAYARACRRLGVLVERRDQRHGVVEQRDDVRERVTEEPRDSQGDVDARPARGRRRRWSTRSASPACCRASPRAWRSRSGRGSTSARWST